TCFAYFLSVYLLILPPPISTLFPYTTLFRSLPPGQGFMRLSRVFECKTLSDHNLNLPVHHQLEQFIGGRLHGFLGWNIVPKLGRSEEHTSELQSRENLVCRLLLEKKKKINRY